MGFTAKVGCQGRMRGRLAAAGVDGLIRFKRSVWRDDVGWVVWQELEFIRGTEGFYFVTWLIIWHVPALRPRLLTLACRSKWTVKLSTFPQVFDLMPSLPSHTHPVPRSLSSCPLIMPPCLSPGL